MGKVSLFIYVTIALLLLLLLSKSPNKPHSNRRHRRLKVRSSFNFRPTHHEPVPFDPLVADIERRREDRQWEKQYIEHAHHELSHNHDAAPGEEAQPEWEDFMNAEDYLNDEEKFNVTDRYLHFHDIIE